MRVRCFMLLLQGCEPLTSQWLLACLRRYRSMTLAWHVLFNVFRWIRTPSPQRHWNGGCYGCNYSPLALVALCQIGLLLLTYINSSRYMDNSNHMDHSEIQILERHIYIYILSIHNSSRSFQIQIYWLPIHNYYNSSRSRCSSRYIDYGQVSSRSTPAEAQGPQRSRNLGLFPIGMVDLIEKTMETAIYMYIYIGM